MKSYRPLLLLPLAVALLVVVTGRIDAQSFTLEQVMSSPFPSDLTVSKRGDKVAWAFDAEGKRNIWVAEAPAFNAVERTSGSSFPVKMMTRVEGESSWTRD